MLILLTTMGGVLVVLCAGLVLSALVEDYWRNE